MLIVFALFIVFYASYCQCRGTSDGVPPQNEIDALWSIYQSTNGDGWSFGYNPWNFSGEVVNPCASDWSGVSCYLVDNVTHVESLVLEYRNLVGTIPSAIGNLTHLAVLSLDGNYLYGSIPKEFGLLWYLETFTASVNYLTGVLSDEFYSCSNLMTIDLFHNKIGGPISPFVSQMANLSVAILSSNSFNGTIPLEFGSLPLLKSLSLDSNDFTGTIPRIAGGFPSIDYWTMDSNNLVGTLPPEIGDCLTLVQLYVGNNLLVGSLPVELSKLTKLMTLNFDNNQITGTLPVEFSQLSNLLMIGGENNLLNGTIPDEYYYLPQLGYIQLSNNQISGAISPNISNCTFLTTLELDNNRLTGPIPVELTYLTHLDYLKLNGNFLTSSIPDGIGDVKYLNELYLNDNQLTGTLPLSISKLGDLFELSVANNHLEGSVHSSFSLVTTFRILDLSGNHLTGRVPDMFLGMRLMSQLLLDSNHFSRSIPSSLGKVQSLMVLTLNDNLFSGNIPTFSGLKSLELAFLYSNKLSGSIKRTFNCSLQPSLKFIDVSNNQLTSSLPKELFSCRHLTSFAALSNCFSGPLPIEMCGAGNLTSLVLDGLMSATSCQKRFFTNFEAIVSYGLSSRIPEGVPECLFSLPLLETLHLSGNGLTGTLPRDLSLSPALSYLSLSHNSLRGDIPYSMKRQEWRELDLSYNKITGTLETNEESTVAKDYYIPSNASLSLKVNRLSGHIPAVLKDLSGIQMLDGNIFECDASRSSLPPSDPDYQIYSCGSNSFNNSVYVWCAVACCAVVMIGMCWLLRLLANGNEANSIRQLWSLITLWLSVFSDRTERHHSKLCRLKQFGSFLSSIRKIFLWLTLFIVGVLLPTYLVLSEYYDTYTHEYAWSVSGAYLSGVTPAILLFFLLLLFGFCCWSVLYSYLFGTQESIISAEVEIDKFSVKWLHSTVLLGVVVWNIVLVTGVNIAYVYIDHHYSSAVVQITQVFVALFKVTWNNFIVQYVLEKQKSDSKYETELDRLSMSEEDANESTYKMEANIYHTEETPNPKSRQSPSQSIGLAVFVMLFNNIAAPFIATGYVSSNCFYDIVTSPPPVSVSYDYIQCRGTVQNGNTTFCASYAAASQNTISYLPPFLYSYQCASTFISTYANIFILMLTIDSFFIPLVLWSMKCIHCRMSSTSHRSLNKIITMSLSPLLLDSINVATLLGGKTSLFRLDVFVVKLINIAAVFCTFGVILPPVAVIACVAMHCVTVNTQLMLGRFTVQLRESSSDQADRDKLLRNLNRNCEGALNMFLSGVHIIVPFAAIFFGLVLFDTLGDAVGWQRALVVPLLVCTMPMVAYIRRSCSFQVLWRLLGCGGRDIRISESKAGTAYSYVHQPVHVEYAPVEDHEPEATLDKTRLSMTLLQEHGTMREDH